MLIANLLWSLIPVIVFGLFKEVSILMVIFLRFFISGIILLLITLAFIYINNKLVKNEEMKISLKKLLKFTFRKNERFFNMRYIYYFAILGFFGIILQIIGYFLALKTTTIAFTMIGFPLSIILIAFYEHGVNSEKLDFFKVLYLIILTFSIAIIIGVQLNMLNHANSSITIFGFVYVIFFSICMSFLHIGISKESYNKGEIRFLNINNNYKICRMMIKISLIFLIGTALMFPFILIVSLIPFQNDLSPEITKFYGEFNIFFEILFRGDILFLIIVSTIIPYILLFIASLKWNPYNLTYSQWSSILTLIEPIGGILFGVLFINEYFPIEYLIIIIFLLIISILLRYIHESKNVVNAFLLIDKDQGNLLRLPLELLKFEGVIRVNSLVGSHDLMLNIKTNSIKELYYLINTELKKFDVIKKVHILFINKINKVLIS